jgi:hypothetical protein
MPKKFVRTETKLILIDLSGKNQGQYSLEPGEHEILEVPDPIIQDEKKTRKFWVLARNPAVGMSVRMWTEEHGITSYEKECA